MILRDPAERAFSQYLHQLSVGLTGATFRGHLERCERGGEHELSALYPFLEIGLYHRQVKRFLDLFPRRQICIYWYEDAWRRPANLLADVFRFLRVDADFEPDMSRHSHRRRAPRMVRTHHLLKKSGFWYPLRDLVPGRLLPSFRRFAFRGGRSLTIRPEDRRYLIDYYREDIRNLAGLLNRDLSTWLR
jgi:hypothetical protein